MDSTSLTKPVDLQGLSLALAKTKADYEAQIDRVAVQSDWETGDGNSFSYILNKPAIRAGEGEGSIVEGYLETNSDAKSYSLTITGSGCDFTYTTENEITESANAIKNYGLIFDENDGSGTFYYIRNIDLTNHTIRISRSYSGGEKTRQVTLFYKTRLVKGKDAHAEGVNTLTCSVGTHAEGNWSMALSSYAHAEGFMSRAGGTYSHAEGGKTEALGLSSHAEGTSTIARGNHQHAQGKYNIEDDSNTYAHIVGNGTSESNRSNAHTLDWSGNAWYAGKLTVGAAPTNNMDVATKKYVDDTVGAVNVGVTGVKGDSESTYRTGQVNITAANIGALTAESILDATKLSGTIPTACLPSYVDDVLEYTTESSFPSTGESGKIYVDTTTNLTYRWSGSAYVEISPSLALGTTSSTAFRGDYGNSAYTHAVTNKGSAFTSGLYKITTNSEGHVTGAVAVQKSDITGLGIPAQDTTYTFDGTYNASTNKAATVSTVTNAVSSKANTSDVLTKNNTTSYTPTANYHPATKKYVDDSISGFSTDLSGLSDTTIATPSDGQLLKYNATSGKWENVTLSLAINNNVIQLKEGNTVISSVTLPVYNGGVSS